LEEYRTELYLRQFLPQVRPFPKVRELFERIGSDGRRIALATSAKAVELGSLRQMLNVDDLVDYVVDAGDVKKSKPDSDVFECALSGLSISADEAIAVGDTPYDAKAATKIHVRCIGLLCGGFPEAELWQAGCIEIYRDPAELLECYERSSLSEERLAS
jgi:HAD superfamily hydrolase (TIGR01509 family)